MPLMPDAGHVASFRASYTADPWTGRGRAIDEAPSQSRTAFQRDRDRIIHSSAFRRLALKTQVFLPEQGDHYRTRLTHSIEVAQITRTLTRALGLDDDLGEALALAHDLGHTPFGHTGEEALGDVLARFGGFDHNAQTLRVVTLLERRYAGFPGLNLTWDTIEGLLKRDGRRLELENLWHCGDLPCLAKADAWVQAFGLLPQPSAEAQAAALADDIAYNAHDLEDGLEAGLFGLADLDEVPLLVRIKRDLVDADPSIAPDLLVRGLARQLVGLFVDDAIAESRRRLRAHRIESVADIRALESVVIGLSSAMVEASNALKAFLFERMYRHPHLLHVRMKAKRIVRDLAAAFLADAALLPPEWRPVDPRTVSATLVASRITSRA